MQTKDNKDLYDLILALAGVDQFTSTEQPMIRALANRRLYEAYNKMEVWPRYLIAGEPRTIASQIISTTEDSRYVYSGGTTEANGLYVANGTSSSGARAYTLYDTDGTTAEYSIEFLSGQWNLIVGAPDSGGAIQYYNDDASNTSDAASPTIAETGWTVDNGTSPAPTVRDLAEITDFIKVHREQPYLNNSVLEYEFFVQPDGCHVLNPVTNEATTVYVTYRIALTELTDLDQNTVAGVSNVPLEFFHFIAHATYADFLRMDGQTEKAMVEEQVAESYLLSEIERAEKIMNVNTIRKSFKTHLSTQSR